MFFKNLKHTLLAASACLALHTAQGQRITNYSATVEQGKVTFKYHIVAPQDYKIFAYTYYDKDGDEVAETRLSMQVTKLTPSSGSEYMCVGSVTSQDLANNHNSLGKLHYYFQSQLTPMTSGSVIPLYEPEGGLGGEQGTFSVNITGLEIWRPNGEDMVYTYRKIGANVSYPTQALDVNGQVRIRGGSPGANKVLTSDANGVGTWQALAWQLNGTHLYNSNTGNVGIKTNSPTQALDVNGQVRIRGGLPGANKVLTSDANGVGTWQTQPWQINGTNVYYNGGNVGIGTNTPQTLLSIKQNEAIQLGEAYMSSGTHVQNNDTIQVSHFGSNAWYRGNNVWKFNGKEGALMQTYDKNINFFSHDGIAGSFKLGMKLVKNEAINLGNAYMSSGTDGSAQISHFGSNAWFGNGVWNFAKNAQGNSLHGAFMQTYNKDINFFTHEGNSATFANIIRFSKNASGTFINFDDGTVADTTEIDENKKYQIGVSVADTNKFVIRHVKSEQSLLIVDGGEKAQVVIGRKTPNNHAALKVVGDLECVPHGTGSANRKTRPDYVFENTYDLMPLEAVEAFIKANKHLPKFKSAKEVEKAGGQIQLGEFSYQLLEKVEELTLYAIEQDKKINQQNELIEKLTQRLENLEKKVNQTR